MRLLTSLLRILLGVSLGIGYFAGLAYLPYPYSALLFCVFYWLLTGGFFYKSIRALRIGKFAVNAGGRFLVYERTSFEYWFYTLLSVLIGLLTFWMSLCALFPSRFHF